MDHLRYHKCKKKQLEKFFQIINIYITDADKSEKKELTKKRTFTKNTWCDWYDWFINYIPEPIIKSAGGVKDQI